jgi:hypothetical protein
MAKPVISPEGFVAEVNKRLHRHHAYEPGMHVFLVPEGANGKIAKGYDFEPPEAAGVVADIANHVALLYTVDPPLSPAPHG